MTEETVGTALPAEIERCQELLVAYQNIGPAGAFGLLMIKRDIAAAIKAIAEQDLPGMIRALEALRGCE